jgi:prepilin-type N-terminal cleavage/methylation domain-containing protein
MNSTRLSVRRGLTLIELLITVTVLSIACAIAIPSISQTGVLRVQSAVRTIASDIAQAQTEAMAFQTRRALFFGAVASDPSGSAFKAGNGYAVVEPTGTSLALDELQNYRLYMPEDPGVAYARSFANDTRYGGAEIVDADFDGQVYLAFDELGGPLKSLATPEPGSGGTVRIESPGYGVAYVITVEAMTGRVDVALDETYTGPGYTGELDGSSTGGMAGALE